MGKEKFSMSQRVGRVLILVGLFGILGGIIGYTKMWYISPAITIGYLMWSS
jgi:hypothetical protein